MMMIYHDREDSQFRTGIFRLLLQSSSTEEYQSAGLNRPEPSTVSQMTEILGSGITDPGSSGPDCTSRSNHPGSRIPDQEFESVLSATEQKTCMILAHLITFFSS